MTPTDSGADHARSGPSLLPVPSGKSGERAAPAARARAAHDLDLAAGLCVLGLRACGPEAGAAPAAPAVRAFAQALGTDGAAALSCFVHLTRCLRHRGRRRVRFAIVGAAGVTPDEMSALAAMTAAQADEPAALDHLAWLFAGAVPGNAAAALEMAAAILAGRGLWVAAPPAPPRPLTPTPLRVVAG